MPAKTQIEMMTADDHQVVDQLPAIHEVPATARPVHVPSAWAKAKGISAPPPAELPRWPETPLSRTMNAPLGVQKALAGASESLRARGHNVLAMGTDALGRVLPDSASGFANAALGAYGLRGGFKGGAAAEGAPVEEEPTGPVGAGEGLPTPPAAPARALPEQAPVTARGTRFTPETARMGNTLNDPQYAEKVAAKMAPDRAAVLRERVQRRAAGEPWESIDADPRMKLPTGTQAIGKPGTGPEFGGMRTNANFTEGSGGLADLAAGKIRPYAMPGAPIPTARFAFDWPEAGGAQYHIEGGPYDRSTVSAARLSQLGIPIPEAPGPGVHTPTTEDVRTTNQAREQFYANRNDPRIPHPPAGDLQNMGAPEPTPPSPTFENKSPNREKIDAAKKLAGGAAGAAVLGATGSASASDPDYTAKEQALMTAMKAAGHPIVKVGGDRTAEQQAALYAKSPKVTEKSGQPGDESRHQQGLAGDFAFVGKDGKPDFSESQPWNILGRMAKANGLEWGGDFKTLADRGHVQLSAGNAGNAGGAGTGIGQPTPSVPTPATPGIKIEPMGAEDHQAAASLPLWRQALDPIMEGLPTVGAATGGMLGGAFALPTVAVTGGTGPALAGVGGAYAGGTIGAALRDRYRQATGQEPPKDFKGSIDSMSEEGRSQMYAEMLGLGVLKGLTSRAATKVFGATSARLANTAHDLRLSAAELSDSPIGRGIQKALTYASATAKAAQDAARRVGDSNAIRSVTDTLDQLTRFQTATQSGEEIRGGVEAGASALREGPIGQAYQTAKKSGPNIDLRSMIEDLKQTFKNEGTTTAARNAIMKLFPKAVDGSAPSTAWLPPSATAARNAVAPTGPTPYEVTFEQAAKLRTRLGLAGRKALIPVGTDATSLATKLYGDLSDMLTQAHPQFGPASAMYRDARQALSQRFVAGILKQSPDTIVKALGPTPPSATIEALKTTMLGVAQSTGMGSPEAQAGAQGFQALRRQWFDTHILRDSAGKADPVGMLARMTKADPQLKAFFGITPGDTEGQQVVDTAKSIAQALNRRVGSPSDGVTSVTRGAELVGLLETLARAGAGTAAKTAAGYELLPGFITWAMHRPGVAKAFVTGLTDPNTIRGTALLGRTLAGYMASGGPTDAPEPDFDAFHVYTGPGTGANGTSGTSGTNGTKQP